MTTHPNPQLRLQLRAARRDAKYWRKRAAEAKAAGDTQAEALYRRSAERRDADGDDLERRMRG